MSTAQSIRHGRKVGTRLHEALNYTNSFANVALDEIANAPSNKPSEKAS
jgi:hypothetical protein